MTTLARTHVAARRNVPPFDYILVVATLMVSAIGVIMVYTATRGALLAQRQFDFIKQTADAPLETRAGRRQFDLAGCAVEEFQFDCLFEFAHAAAHG